MIERGALSCVWEWNCFHGNKCAVHDLQMGTARVLLRPFICRLLQVARLQGNQAALSHCTAEELAELKTTIGTFWTNMGEAIALAHQT